MSEQKLRDALRELPRVSARDGFTEDVLSHIDEVDGGASRDDERKTATPAPSRATRPWLGLAAAAAIVFATTFAFVHFERQRDVAMQHAGGNGETQTLTELRAEHEQLRNELSQLMKLGPSSSPVVYLGGTDDLDIVFDLGRAPAASNPETMPASYPSSSDARSIY
jgi:hypothetical protein